MHSPKEFQYLFLFLALWIKGPLALSFFKLHTQQLRWIGNKNHKSQCILIFCFCCLKAVDGKLMKTISTPLTATLECTSDSISDQNFPRPFSTPECSPQFQSAVYLHGIFISQLLVRGFRIREAKKQNSERTDKNLHMAGRGNSEQKGTARLIEMREKQQFLFSKRLISRTGVPRENKLWVSHNYNSEYTSKSLPRKWSFPSTTQFYL